MSQEPRVKKEPTPPPTSAAASSSTTIGGAVKVQFAPRIPVRRRPGSDAPPPQQTSNELRDLITTKTEKKRLVPPPRFNSAQANPESRTARVAFQPSSTPGQGVINGGGSGEETMEGVVNRTIIQAPAPKIPGQDAPTTADVKPRVKKEKAVNADGSVSMMDIDEAEASMTAEELAESQAEEEMSAMIARESEYDATYDNGDPRQYRPISLPFPRVRLGTQGSASTARSTNRSTNASPAERAGSRPGSAFGAAASMFDLEDEGSAAQSFRPPSASAHSSAAPWKNLPLNTPARLLGQIDHEEKMCDPPIPGARNILFFQFPSHLPFKQTASWQPPLNPLLSLNGFRQSSLGTSTSAITFGANTNEVSHQNMASASRNLPVQPNSTAAAASSANQSNLTAPSPSLQALHALSSPALPPLHANLGLPNFSLGSAATTGQTSATAAGKKGAKPMSAPSTALPSNLMDDVGTGAALATEEEQDLGEVNNPNQLSESERLAREHKARQQRKLLLFSSNFEHAMRHLPPGQLGSLVIYKSGKIKMKIGDILLDVNEGVQCLFHQELLSVQASTGEAFRLGPVNHRLVCTNDVEDLVRKSRERAVPQPQA